MQNALKYSSKTEKTGALQNKNKNSPDLRKADGAAAFTEEISRRGEKIWPGKHKSAAFTKNGGEMRGKTGNLARVCSPQLPADLLRVDGPEDHIIRPQFQGAAAQGRVVGNGHYPQIAQEGPAAQVAQYPQAVQFR